jgi:hypothetical protein
VRETQFRKGGEAQGTQSGRGSRRAAARRRFRLVSEERIDSEWGSGYRPVDGSRRLGLKG